MMKKRRGVLRRLRLIQKWKEESKDLNLDSITVSHSKHLDIQKSLFEDLLRYDNKKIDPKTKTRVKDIIIKSLLEIYDEWNIIIKKEYKEYYLKVWIYPHNFLESKIVLAVEEKIPYYSTNLGEAIKDIKKPMEIRRNENEYKWSGYRDYKVYPLSLIKGNRDKILELERKAFKIVKEDFLGEKEKYYYIHKGTIWIGDRI